MPPESTSGLQHDYFERAKAEGRLIEIDYPCRPRWRDWSSSPAMTLLASRLEFESVRYRESLRMLSGYVPQLIRIKTCRSDDDSESSSPVWANGWLPGLDALSLYGFVAARNPAVYLEIGSGNSTKFVRQAIIDHNLRTRVISIDPAPRANIDIICDEVVRESLEDVDLSIFSSLSTNDVVFVDNSHRSFQNSDVTVVFMEVIGRLPRGCLYGMHDIFLPLDYPETWVDRFYNEQYLLAAYLFGGGDGDEIVLPAAFVSTKPSLLSELNALWMAPGLDGIEARGGAFWLQKG